jgi:hypothetical protein
MPHKVTNKRTTKQGIVAGVPFFDEVFTQLGCTYVQYSNPTLQPYKTAN